VTGVLTALFLAVSAHAIAQTPGTRAPWQAAAGSPRAGLPAVSVEVGYPGPYVPSYNTPVVLRATAGDLGFDGYIGFHFETAGRTTLDSPVIARASIRPHQTWTFRTIATLHVWNDRPRPNPFDPGGLLEREFVVEWRDRASKRIASANAGKPPWITGAVNRLPLLIRPANQENAVALGRTAYVETTGSLSDSSQWYAGFSSIVVPLAAWLDLRPAVREAIVASLIEVVFIGLPRTDQTIDSATKALLPIELSGGDCAYTVPWPYGSGEVKAANSWSAKRTAGFTGSGTCPFIVRTLAAAWVADERGISQQLPSLVHVRSRSAFLDFDPRVRDHRPWKWGVAALLTTAATWLLVRRNRLVAGAVLAVAFVAMTAMTRTAIRKSSSVDDHVLRASLAPGIGVEYHLLLDYGPTPLAAAPVDRKGITGSEWLPKDAEVRTSETSPSMGAIYPPRSDWAFDVRWKIIRTVTSQDSPRVIVHAGNDLHSFVLAGNSLADREPDYRIQLETLPMAGGRAKAIAALSTGRERTVRITMPGSFTEAPVTLTWATGSVELPLPLGENGRSAVIPADLLRAIDAGGGVFEITARPAIRLTRPNTYMHLQVQERS
jgi:hypothetical protein